MSQQLRYAEIRELDVHDHEQDVSAILESPALAKECIGQYALVGMAREYIDFVR